MPSSKLSASSWKGRLRPARSNNGQHAHTYDRRGADTRPHRQDRRGKVRRGQVRRRRAQPSATPSARRPPSPQQHACVAGTRGFWSALEGTGKSRNGSTYYLILGSTLALTAIGIMMVLSASSVEAIAAGESPYSAPSNRVLFAAIGVFAMFVLSRVNVVWLKRFAWPHVPGHRAAGPGASRRTQRPGQPELDRRRTVHLPALRSGQTGAGALDGHGP